ncbi:hypothetical protein GLAREA_07977 [Glarea lozoyensis ATCC 20868]|uniref:Uncharacterized protein n=1 Tax=Glarea lozoyensis (strain ATCC 20868 / MF5171) TaxID=1116229 RepID=S3CC09_GLAL2|nr:uncharacterized protein GLAREA_07977 [Glarea lozoyensis ATCC 20868]EPE24127.1 hypothetical protein GLAREA_07977 [Glarea lozoyensis ATCC 20868]
MCPEKFVDSGNVQIVDHAEKSTRAYMTGSAASIYFGNGSFVVRRLIATDPLSPGTSGCWVVRGEQLLGHVVGGNEFEKTLYMADIHDTRRSVKELPNLEMSVFSDDIHGWASSNFASESPFLSGHSGLKKSSSSYSTAEDEYRASAISQRGVSSRHKVPEVVKSARMSELGQRGAARHIRENDVAWYKRQEELASRSVRKENQKRAQHTSSQPSEDNAPP